MMILSGTERYPFRATDRLFSRFALPEKRGEIAVELIEEKVEVEEVVGGDRPGVDQAGALRGGEFADRLARGTGAVKVMSLDHGGDEALVVAAVTDDGHHPEVVAVADHGEIRQLVAATAGATAGDSSQDE